LKASERRDETSRRTKSSGSELKSELVKAALSALRETTQEELSLREVARRAGVSHNAPYHHYAGGKAELFADVAAEGFRCLRRDLLTRTERGEFTAEERLQEMAAAYVRFAFDNRALYRIMYSADVFNSPDPDRVQRPIADLYGDVRACVVEAQHPGRRPLAAADSLATAYTTMLHGLAMGIVDGLIRRVVPTPETAEGLARTLARAMFPKEARD
jgi:AcrR family transcriptional regulator